jgi:hypothetical protein
MSRAVLLAAVVGLLATASGCHHCRMLQEVCCWRKSMFYHHGLCCGSSCDSPCSDSGCCETYCGSEYPGYGSDCGRRGRRGCRHSGCGEAGCSTCGGEACDAGGCEMGACDSGTCGSSCCDDGRCGRRGCRRCRGRRERRAERCGDTCSTTCGETCGDECVEPAPCCQTRGGRGLLDRSVGCEGNRRGRRSRGDCDQCGDASCGGDCCGETSCDECGGRGCSRCRNHFFSLWGRGDCRGRRDRSWAWHGDGCNGHCGRMGCGEVYWCDWISSPPECCDPCDDCGNWIGHRGAPGRRGRTRYATEETYYDEWPSEAPTIHEAAPQPPQAPPVPTAGRGPRRNGSI